MDSAGFKTGEKREILGARYGRNMCEFMESLDFLDWLERMNATQHKEDRQ